MKGQVRIIGGKWRGRKIPIAPIGVRPTPDRVRETVFNWLQFILPNAYCLDAFAGSGAFGFEALSRGAAHVTLTDQSQEVIRLLQTTATRLEASHIDIYRATIPSELKKPSHPFNIVFLDPPYQEAILLSSCYYLEKNNFLAEKAYLYLESNTFLSPDDLPANWQILKTKKTGQVVYQLILRGHTL